MGYKTPEQILTALSQKKKIVHQGCLPWEYFVINSEGQLVDQDNNPRASLDISRDYAGFQMPTEINTDDHILQKILKYEHGINISLKELHNKIKDYERRRSDAVKQIKGEV